MNKLKYFALILLVLAMVFTSCVPLDFSDPSGDPTSAITGEVALQDALRVTYIDVGQGDSALVEFPSGKCMLIDAGEKDEVENVLRTIRKSGHEKIDFLVMTHPHSDHMGGMAEVMESFEIGVLYMTNAVNTTSAFEEILDVAERKDIPIKRSQKGVVIYEEGFIKAEFLSPVSEEYEELNDYSSVIKITSRERSFLFMGDAEKLAEDELGAEVRSDVVKVGHHGSKTSSSENFVKKTKAIYAVISVGEGNRYGHPASLIVTRWEEHGARILRTDIAGNIVFTTDGEKLYLKCEKNDELGGEITLPNTEIPTDTPATAPAPTVTPVIEYLWILNINTKKIHRPSCSSVQKMNEENKGQSQKNLDELLSEGYTACGICKPSEE